MPRSLQCAIALMLTSRLSAQVAQMSDSEMRRVAARVSELDVRRQFPSATVATVDSLLAFYSDSVVYEHPSVDAVVRGKAALLAGMLQYMGSRPTTTIDAPRITIGARIAVLDVAAQPDPRDPARPIPAGRRAIRVLEFDAQGKVRRILDYPW